MSQDTDDILTIPLDEALPVIPLRDTVIFPFTMFPLLVGRPSTIAAINDAVEQNKLVLLLGQTDPEQDTPGKDDLYPVGTLGRITQVLKLPNNLMKVLVSGLQTVEITTYHQEEPYLAARFVPVEHAPGKSKSKLEALVKRARERFERFVMINQELPDEVLFGFQQITDPVQLLFYMASYLDLDMPVKQTLLAHKELSKQYTELLTIISSELELLAVSMEINEKVQEEIQETQRKFFIQEQIKLLQDELDEDGYGDPELAKLKEQLDALPIPEQAKQKAVEELDRLKKTPQMSPEYSVSRNYIDWMLAMPWGKFSDDRLDIKAVEKLLNDEHFGLEKPKERILEHIAVLNLVKHLKGQILCFVGPPGTGKTSLAKSIAHALGRNMVRIALGGIHDEGEIRGHRKTYIGAMPGRIIQAMKKAGSMNPVIILDEIDKIGSDFRGDPSAAILEVLDPEQNYSFNDHYLDIDFDLSQVMFITTANVASEIQPALLDRMELINLPGYLEHDKLEISKQHLIPKQMTAHGLSKKHIVFKDDAIMEIIRKYTAEAGVRRLEQQLAALIRKVAKNVVSDRAEGKKEKKITVTIERVHELLGVEKYRDRDVQKTHKIGSVNGLAWTSTGGSILQIEVAKMLGKEKFLLTGQLGDVMKESAQAALTFIRSNAERFGIDPQMFEKTELHIHLPEGAIPKDGPSAGMAMALAILSLLTQKPLRFDVAMTGEITLRGEIFAIGGLNEKLLAAQRHNIKKVLIPKDNMRDLAEIPAKIKEGLEIIGVDTLDEAIPHVFAGADDLIPKSKKKHAVKRPI